MDFICGFGSPTCGPEDIVGWVGVIITIMSLGAAFAVAIQQIRAASFGRPVLAAQSSRISLLEQENREQSAQMATQEEHIKAQSGEITHLRELVTQAANVDGFHTDAREWRMASQREHEAQTETLERIAESLARSAASQAITSRTMVAIARKLDVRVRDSDIA